jgi:DNA-binding MarR family transcriptional regulator
MTESSPVRLRASAAKGQADPTGPAWVAPSRQKLDLQLWVRLLACTHSAQQLVKANIKDRFGLNQTQFNLLSQLDRAPDGIRMGEIARRTVVTGSNVTAVIDDLVRRGLVSREAAEGDRRAIVIKLTAKGRRAFALMAPVHAQWIQEIFAGVAEADKRALVRQLDALKAAMRATLRTSI